MAPNRPPNKVRAFRPADAAGLVEIYTQAVCQGARANYSAEQIRVWMSLAPSPREMAQIYGDGRSAFVAVDDADRPVGFADLENDGHIQFLYVSPAAAGLGIAHSLLARIEIDARRRGIPCIFAEASAAAVGVFEKFGFRQGERRDLVIDGVAIHNHTVRKVLVEDTGADA